MIDQPPNDEPMLSLHRYFLQANQLRVYFDTRLKAEGAVRVEDDAWPAQRIDLCLWYASLYAVVEGWRELRLTDGVIGDLIDSPNTSLLRRFRNGVVHFQPRYWDARFVELMSEGPAAAEWARELNREFGRFFLAWLRAH